MQPDQLLHSSRVSEFETVLYVWFNLKVFYCLFEVTLFV